MVSPLMFARAKRTCKMCNAPLYERKGQHFVCDKKSCIISFREELDALQSIHDDIAAQSNFNFKEFQY